MKFHFSEKFILASGSPRRKQLLNDLGLNFEVYLTNVDEDFSSGLTKEEIPLFLAEKKALAVPNSLAENHTIIAADTIVWINEKVLNKPQNFHEAFEMISEISGNKHTVFTGVCLRRKEHIKSFYCATEVTFRKLIPEEIIFYIDNFKPFDKAGSYGAQDWIGLVGIEKLNGCYFNVMGLPVRDLYLQLQSFPTLK
jgi:septum formation protein